MIEHPKTPHHVMRFYSNIDYALETIGFREIVFIHAYNLNDPFDPYLNFVTDFNEDYHRLINKIKHHGKDNVELFKELLPQDNWNKFIDKIKQNFINTYDNIFLFSTCGISKKEHPNTNLYMWSHYGNGHRGVAIEFDSNILKNAVLDKNPNSLKKIYRHHNMWTKVKYTDNVPKIKSESIYSFVIDYYGNNNNSSLENTDLGNSIKNMVSTKNKVWKHENEWRLMWLNDETKLKIQRIKIPEGTISAVYLGCRFNESERHVFLSETKRNFPDAKVFICKTKKGEFSLEFKPLI